MPALGILMFWFWPLAMEIWKGNKQIQCLGDVEMLRKDVWELN